MIAIHAQTHLLFIFVVISLLILLVMVGNSKYLLNICKLYYA